MLLKKSSFERINFAGLLTVFLLAGVPAFAVETGHNISAANLRVIQNDEANNATSVTVTTTLSINDFRVRAGSNRGDYNVQIGDGYDDDVSQGIMISSISENGRDNADPLYPGINYCTTAIAPVRSGYGTGGYIVSSFTAPAGPEFNINVAAAFFPYTNWLGGLAYNSGSTNGGQNDVLIGSPGLVLGTHFIDNGGGRSIVNLKSLGINSQISGVLLVSHGKNEDNYALSQANSDGTWTVYIKDNGTDGGSYERDPVAFVYVPRTNRSVISGKFRGDGTPMIFSGATPQFTAVNTSVGTWRLRIPGQSPATGVLILSAEGGGGVNQDNIVSYQPDGDSWIIQSRDLPGTPPGLQTPTPQSEAVASFVFIPAPTASLVSPVNVATNTSLSPLLKLALTNSENSNLTVKFFGRELASNVPGRDFTIVALPDTQYYVGSNRGGLPGMFYAQTDWINANLTKRNIAFVAQLGDCVDKGDNNGVTDNIAQWRNATNALYRLEPPRLLFPSGVPYGVAVGNHDQSPNGDPNGTTKYYNQFFGVSHFANRSYYGGHYGTNNDNHYDLFSVSGVDFVAIFFEYDVAANPAVLRWADEVLRTNSTRRGIIISHYIGRPTMPSTFGAQGAAIYNALKGNTNLFLMLSGHVDGEGSRTDVSNGSTVYTLVSDFQFRTNGGNGFLRSMEFSPSNGVMRVTTYSPWLNAYETDADSQFTLPCTMLPSDKPFAQIATKTVSSEQETAFAWAGLKPNTSYEWFATISDGVTTSTTETRRFTTGLSNSGPVVTNMYFTLQADVSTNLALNATDANGDAVTFQMSSLTTHGIVQDFDVTTGTFTYTPEHGFSGEDGFVFRANDGQLNSSLATAYFTVVPPQDSNTNGIPDYWETKFGITNANADADGDGLSNLEEYLANTNPTNAASALRVIDFGHNENGQFFFKWSSVGGSRYRIQYSDADSEGGFNGAFTDVIRPVANEMDSAAVGTPSTQSFSETVSGDMIKGNRFYRVKILP